MFNLKEVTDGDREEPGAPERINLHAPPSKMELKENRILHFGKEHPHCKFK
jgi:hypothetical protein